MWKLEVAEGHDPWLLSTNAFVGRQVWEFDPDLGTPEEHAEVEKARERFSQNRFQVKASSDVLKNLQLIKENGIDLSLPSVRLGDREEITCEKAEMALRKAVRFTSALQARDGHWPFEFSALLFEQPFMVIALDITGTLNTILSAEHKREMVRYIYNHQSLNMIVNWADDPNQDSLKRHLATVPDYLWVAEDGMKNMGSQLWDSVFATQAIIASNLTDEYGSTLRKAFNFIKLSQIRENPSGDFQSTYHQICKGAWTLTVKDQGWQVSDCTAEALKTLLLLSQMPADIVGDTIEVKQLYEAVDFLLTLQSENGGFSAWEPATSPQWMEKLSVVNSQLESGEFPQQEITGASLKTSMLHYASYRNIFPLWALGEYRKHVLLPKQNT